MKLLLIIFGTTLAMGLYFILADLLKVPKLATERPLLSFQKSERNAAKSFENILLGLSMKLSKFIRLDDHKRRRLTRTLAAAEIDMTPELYTANSLIKPAIISLLIVPCTFILPILSPVLLILAVLVYFKESRKAEEIVRKKTDKIEGELPRFAATIEQELTATRDILRILESYRHHAGEDFARELSVLTADMRSSSFEAALVRFEARLGSAAVSNIVRGLIGVLRGDDGRMYFQMLSRDLKQAELRRLKAKAEKIPPKIRVFSFVLLACFMLTYVVVLASQIIGAMGTLF